MYHVLRACGCAFPSSDSTISRSLSRALSRALSSSPMYCLCSHFVYVFYGTSKTTREPHCPLAVCYQRTLVLFSLCSPAALQQVFRCQGPADHSLLQESCSSPAPLFHGSCLAGRLSDWGNPCHDDEEPAKMVVLLDSHKDPMLSSWSRLQSPPDWLVLAAAICTRVEQ